MSTLPPTAWAVLGLLSFGRELSGYDLKKWADSSLRYFYWSPAISQIYGELRRLEGLGYVESRTAAQDDLRNKRMYGITATGRDALAGWAHDAPVEPPVLKHGVLLRVWMGHLAGPDVLRRNVLEHREYVDEVIDVLKAGKVNAENEPAFTYPALVIRWGLRYYLNERELADQLLRELDELNDESQLAPVGSGFTED